MGRLVSWLASRQMEDGGENAKYDIHPATDPLKEYIIPQVKTTFIFYKNNFASSEKSSNFAPELLARRIQL